MALRWVEERPVAGRMMMLEPGHVIGREGCEIVLPDPEVSRRHAALKAMGDGIGIEDLGSLNGTFVNGERISEPVALKAGDTVQLGNTIWRIVE
jgi:pSer/pThr/pTyr-binding forkhead associated (FHA) protein